MYVDYEDPVMDYDQSVDMYAFSIVLWEMLTHEQPWAESGYDQIIEGVCQGRRPLIPSGVDLLSEEDAPAGWIQLISDCWQQEPEHRPTFESVRAQLRRMQQHP